MASRVRDDRGSAGVGVALGATSLLVVMMFGIGALRITTTNGQVSAASRAAARAASAEYGELEGRTAAERVVGEMFAGREQDCANARVEVRGSWSPGGSVTASVTCVVDLSGVALAGFDRHRTVVHSATEVVDSLRGQGS